MAKMALCQTKAPSTSPTHGSVSNPDSETRWDRGAEAIAGSAISASGSACKMSFRPNPKGYHTRLTIGA